MGELVAHASHVAFPMLNLPCNKPSSIDEAGLDESHAFYKNIPAGIFGSKKPRSAEEVYKWINCTLYHYI